MLVLKPSKVSVKFIQELPAKQFRQVWLKVLGLLVEPFPNDSSKLQGYDFYRVDFGEYRIIYQVVNDTTLDLILIGKRNDDEVYKQLKRLN
jgi:mRNA interferase RelE/StbE